MDSTRLTEKWTSKRRARLVIRPRGFSRSKTVSQIIFDRSHSDHSFEQRVLTSYRDVQELCKFFKWNYFRQGDSWHIDSRHLNDSWHIRKRRSWELLMATFSFRERKFQLKNSCSWSKLLNSRQQLYEFLLGRCCSRYASLFKKSRLGWNCEVLAENELSVWHRPRAHVWGIALKPGVVFDWPYLSRRKSDLHKFGIKKALMTSAFECAISHWGRATLSKVIPFQKLHNSCTTL
jgi:hypothetical protein